MNLLPGDSVHLKVKGVRVPGVVRRWDGAARVIIATKAGDLTVNLAAPPKDLEGMRRFDS
jgi:hypothetical protein